MTPHAPTDSSAHARGAAVSAVGRSQPELVVVTPVKNEAWILGRFLDATAAWADRVVVADQHSSDGSRDIARAYSHVQLVDNPSEAYDEGARQRLLLREARGHPAERVIFALDADEMLSANAFTGDFFDRVRALPPGTAVRMRWANLLPGFTTAWLPSDDYKVFAMVDDGSAHAGHAIHSARLPVSDEQRVVTFDDVVVLHFQFVAWGRMESKQRWYQCWERLHHPDKRPIRIYRQYHNMHVIPESEVRPVDPAWLAGYERLGIGLLPETPRGPTRWDRDVLEWILEHGRDRFARLDVWDVDWVSVASEFGIPAAPEQLADPRGLFTRTLFRWLRQTQNRAGRTWVRNIQRLLAPFGW